MRNVSRFIFILVLTLPGFSFAASPFDALISKHNINIEIESIHKGALSGAVNMWFELYLSHDGFSEEPLKETLYFSEAYFSNSKNYVRPDSEILVIPKQDIKTALQSLKQKVIHRLGEGAQLNPSIKVRLYFSKALAKDNQLITLADEVVVYNSSGFNKKHSVYNRGRYYGYTYSELNLRLFLD